ncbi:hypothetical protein WN66_00865 [Saccharomyces cerevisiae]|nr:hypothetical protein WN66_00865 [Saccharomyces cerevisiae]
MLFQLNIVFKELKNPDFFFFFFFFSLPLSSFKLSLSSSSSFKLWLIVFLLDFGEIMFPAPPLPIANFSGALLPLSLFLGFLDVDLIAAKALPLEVTTNRLSSFALIVSSSSILPPRISSSSFPPLLATFFLLKKMFPAPPLPTTIGALLFGDEVVACKD